MFDYVMGVWLWRISGELLTGDDGVGFESQFAFNPITIVGTEIGRTLKYLSARSYSAMLLILLGRFGKDSFGFTGTIRTLNDRRPFWSPYWNL